MQIVNSQVSDVTVIALSGSLDAASVADFDAEWKAALDAGATKLVVDLGGIEYISSAGLRGILKRSGDLFRPSLDGRRDVQALGLHEHPPHRARHRLGGRGPRLTFNLLIRR